MINLVFSGSLSKLPKEVIPDLEDFVFFSLKRLLGKRFLEKKTEYRLVIDFVHGLRSKEGNNGDIECVEFERYGYRHFVIHIDSQVTLSCLYGTIAHELVHFKQYMKGELKFGGRKNITLWNDAPIDENKCSYWEFPWEIEAIGRTPGLVHLWYDSLNKVKRSIYKKILTF